MNTSTLRIVSIVQERVDAFLKEIFDICQSVEGWVLFKLVSLLILRLSFGSSKTKSLWDTIATEVAACDVVDLAIRRRRNERAPFAQLSTDLVHSIFGIVLEVDRVHDPNVPVGGFVPNPPQLACLRQVSSAWNDFLLSSPRYWQTIDIGGPPQAITAGIERSGSAALCLSVSGIHRSSQPTYLPEELRSCYRVQTLRSNDPKAYRLCRWLLRDRRPSLQTLQLTARSGPVEPLGELPSIRHITAWWWQPPSDATWLVGLKELVLRNNCEPDVELLRLLSACPNLELFTISGNELTAVEELPGAISLPRLRSIDISYNWSATLMTLMERLIIPQCIRRALETRWAPRLSQYIGGYRRVMSLEESWTQYPKSACILIKGIRGSGVHLSYETENRQARFLVPNEEELPALHDLVQELQDLFQGPSLTVTVRNPSRLVCLVLKSLGDQNIQRIVTYPNSPALGALEAVENFLRAIRAPSADVPDGTLTTTATDWPFKSLRSIDIHEATMILPHFTSLVEEHLNQNSKPLLEEIVLNNCNLEGMELAQATERLAGVGITLRGA